MSAKTTINPRKYYGISRIDQPEKKNHGWYVRVHKFRKKLFSDSIYGSRRRALEAAENQRDIYFDSLPVELQLRASKPRKTAKRAK